MVEPVFNPGICLQKPFSPQHSIASTMTNARKRVENKKIHALLVGGYTGIVILGSSLVALSKIKHTMF